MQAVNLEVGAPGEAELPEQPSETAPQGPRHEERRQGEALGR